MVSARADLRTMIARTFQLCLKPFLAIAFITSLSAQASAQDIGHSIAGDWNLETGEFEEGCHIEGVINLEKTPIPGAYSCRFVSEQICKWPGVDEPHRYIKVQQTCSAQRVGDGVVIKSEVEEILEVRATTPSGGYYPDNFVLRLTKQGTVMLGRQYDDIREISARFWRDIDLTS